MKSFFKIILSHSIFVAFCAAGLTLQSFILTGTNINSSICWLIFFATLGAYNFYWILSKWSHNKKAPVIFSNYRTNLIFLLISLVSIVDYLWQMTTIIPFVIVGILLTALYSFVALPIFKQSIPKISPLIKTVLLASTWTFVTVVIPFNNCLHQSGLMLLILIRFLFLMMLCIIFDSRDVKMDLLLKMSSSIDKMNTITITVLMIVVYCFYNILLINWGKSIFSETQNFILICSGTLAFLLYLLSFKKRGYFFYYFLVDGLMLLSSFASYIATI